MSVTKTEGSYISIEAAAGELSTTHPKVLMLIKQGALEAVMEEGEWLVAVSSVDCVKTHGTPAIQASCRTSCTASGCHCK